MPKPSRHPRPERLSARPPSPPLEPHQSIAGLQTESGRKLFVHRRVTHSLHFASCYCKCAYVVICYHMLPTFPHDNSLGGIAALLWPPRLSWPLLEAFEWSRRDLTELFSLSQPPRAHVKVVMIIDTIVGIRNNYLYWYDKRFLKLASIWFYNVRCKDLSFSLITYQLFEHNMYIRLGSYCTYHRPPKGDQKRGIRPYNQSKVTLKSLKSSLSFRSDTNHQHTAYKHTFPTRLRVCVRHFAFMAAPWTYLLWVRMARARLCAEHLSPTVCPWWLPSASLLRPIHVCSKNPRCWCLRYKNLVRSLALRFSSTLPQNINVEGGDTGSGSACKARPIL